MILLRRLRITAFKHLRNVDLWLPRRGSVLIEGHNESGKSTLFEAIYFALYGRALVGEDAGVPSLDALIPHGETRAGLQLTIVAGATELEITRTLLRGSQQVKHEAEARILRPGRPAETISTVKAVNDCILTEMNGLDGNVLRNSCLMEQQALDRIETLTTANRELAIAKLLGIEALQRIEQELKVARKDEAQLAQAQTRLEVARKHAAAQEARADAQTVATQLRAAQARRTVEARDALAAQAQTAQDGLDEVTREATQIRERSQRAATLEVLRRQSEDAARMLHEAEQQATTLAKMRAQQDHTASAARATDSSVQLAQVAESISAAEMREREQAAQSVMRRRRARTAATGAGLAALAAVMLCVAGLLAHLLWLAALALVPMVAAILLLLRWRGLRAETQSEQTKQAAGERELVQLRATHEAMQRLSAAPEEQAIPDALIAQQRLTEDAHDACVTALRALATALAAAAIPVSSVAVEQAAVESLDALRQAHEAMTQPLLAELARMDVAAALQQQGSLHEREQHLRAERDSFLVRCVEQRARLAELLVEQNLTATGDEPLDTLVGRWPELADAGDPDTLVAALERASAREEQLRQQVEALCRQHGLDAETLDAVACQQAYDALEQELRQRRLAAEMADEVFTRIVQRVLPETEMHMRALLPELTDGRYRDVTLLGEDENSADLRIRVWDEQAGRYVGKSLFSGGTRDQCSLALRLAFALATLPKELGAMPGFIFLDEPLSSFDDRRSQALVDVLTRGPIARQFPQVFLISHSQSFDPAAFTCALRMAGGRVASSTLPDEQAARAQWQPD